MGRERGSQMITNNYKWEGGGLEGVKIWSHLIATVIMLGAGGAKWSHLITGGGRGSERGQNMITRYLNGPLCQLSNNTEIPIIFEIQSPIPLQKKLYSIMHYKIAKLVYSIKINLKTSSQSEITDAPVCLFLIFGLNVLYVLFVLLYFVIWSDSPYELPCQIWSL